MGERRTALITGASSGTARADSGSGGPPPAITTTTFSTIRTFLRWNYPGQVPRVGGALVRPLSPAVRAPRYDRRIVARTEGAG